VIVVSGGRGERLGKRSPKQFISIERRPLLFYALKIFEGFSRIREKILVQHEAYMLRTQSVLKKYKLKDWKLTRGGKTRPESVFSGLCLVKNSTHVMIHDAARPFFSVSDIQGLLDLSSKHPSAAVIPASPVRDTLVRAKSGKLSLGISRLRLFHVATPQILPTVYKTHLQKALRKKKLLRRFTDDAGLFDACGGSVYLYPTAFNLKITYPDDLKLARALLRK